MNKMAWKKRDTLEPAAKDGKEKAGWRNPRFQTRYGNKERKNRSGQGRKPALEFLEKELKEACKKEEKIYGHKLGPEDIMVMYYELLAKEAVQLYVKKKDYDGAIRDYEAALRVMEYPAVRKLLDEAKVLRGTGK